MAFTDVSANGYKVAVEAAIAIADSAGANVVNSYSSTISDNLSNKKFVVMVEVTEVCAGDGAIDLAIQGSLDGSVWVDLDASLSMDVDPTGTNSGAGLADLTSIYAPYYRIKIFTDGTDILDAAAVTVSYAFKNVQLNV